MLKKKKIPLEYTKELEYYKETGLLTSSLFLYSNMVFMDEILYGHPIDERASQRLTLMGVTPENVAAWKRVYNEHHAIEEKIKEFNEVCWPSIKDKNDETTWKTLRFLDVEKEVTLLSRYTGGRILITLGTLAMDGDKHVSVVGDGTTDKGSYTPCGLQGIRASKEDALELLEAVISSWDIKKYIIYKSENVGIC